MKKYLPLVAFLAAIKLAIHLVGNRNFGFHRDELLHLSVGQHLDWGYMEFPPFIALPARISWLIFGESVSGLRIFATLAGIAILILCCMIAKEFGAKRHGILLAGTAVLAFLPFYRNHMLFQPVAFDQLFWTLGFYFLIRFINTRNNKFLIFLGITAGFGLMNKYTFLVWGMGIVAGLLFFDRARIFNNKFLYIAGAIALVIFLPNVIWQYAHDFPILLHMKELKESQLDEIGPYDFLLEQFEFLFTFLLSIIGLTAVLFHKSLNKYKAIGIAVLVIFGLLWILDSKSYYFFAAYPALFAAGAATVERVLARKPIWNYAVAALLVLPTVFYLPHAIPVLPIDKHIAFAEIKPDSNNRYALSDDYADMFGWQEQVAVVAKAYNLLSAADKRNCIILSGNYGEAGAIKMLGDKYGLPNPVCSSGSFWLWGAGTENAEICISIGIPEPILKRLYKQSTRYKTITHQYAIDEENGISVYISRIPIVSLHDIWPTLEKDVFN